MVSGLSLELQGVDPADVEMRLAEMAAAGDLSGFEDTYRLYFPRIRGLIARKYRERPPSEDVTQEAFAKAYKAIGENQFGHQVPHNLYGWIARIAVNIVIDSQRRHARIAMVPVDFNDGGFNHLVDSHDFTEEIEGREGALSMLDALSPAAREAIIAVDILGDSYGQYAGDSGVKLGTVRSRLHRARNDMRQNLLAQESAEQE